MRGVDRIHLGQYKEDKLTPLNVAIQVRIPTKERNSFTS